MDGISSTHEILHSVKTNKEKGVLLKLYFQKAFDSVNWGYLFKISRDRGFSERWISWILKILWGGRVAISINDTLSSYNKCRKDLK